MFHWHLSLVKDRTLKTWITDHFKNEWQSKIITVQQRFKKGKEETFRKSGFKSEAS